VPITLDDLTVNFGHLDRASILSDWRWLVGSARHPVLITALGDAFLQDSRDGSIHLLSCGPATLESVCSDLDEFEGRLKDADFVVEHFAPNVVVALRASGKNLGTGQLYGYKVPPHLGGEYSDDNLEPTDIAVHFSLMGQLHAKARNLDAGTPIDRVDLK
jgi:hypothetical protein